MTSPEINKFVVIVLQSMGYNPTIGESGLLVPINLGIELESREIARELERDMDFIQEISKFMYKQKIGDFSEVKDKDLRASNKEAFLTQKGRIINIFSSSKGQIIIRTDLEINPEGNSTTILFPGEW